MKDKQNPCYECPNRYPGCFADCEQYKAWKAERDALKIKMVKARNQESRITHYTVDMRRKSKRRNGR